MIQRTGDSRLKNARLNGNVPVDRLGFGIVDTNGVGGAATDEPQMLYPIDPIRILRQRLWIIVLVTLMVTGLAAGFTYTQTPTYQASVIILIGQKGGSSTDNLLTEVQGLQGIMETLSTALTTRPVAQGVVHELDLPMSPEAVQANLSAELVGTSQFIEVSYADQDSDRAKRIVNTVGEVFSRQVAEVSSDTNNITATVWEKAVGSDVVSPNPSRNILLALMLGLMLGVGLAFVLDYVDDDWKAPEEVERVSGVPTLGVIPTFNPRVPRNRTGD